MLKTFRKGANGFLAKILLGFLVLTFALWGIGDVFRGAPDNIIAMVNEQPITILDLDAAIRSEQDRTPELTAEVAASLQVRLQMLNRIINTRLLDIESRAVGLDFTQDVISQQIAKDPMFQDADGLFSREVFLNLLRQNNLSQGMYLQRVESDLRINIINGVVANSITASPIMAEMYHHINNEQREASLLLLKPENIAAIKTPNDEELSAHYAQIDENFRKPEYRTYRYVYFNAENISKEPGNSASNEDIRAYYDEQYGDEAAEGAPSFDDSKREIESLLNEEILNSRLAELSNQLDDSVAGGATLEEALQAAKLSSLKIETLGPISTTNMLHNGETYLMKPFEQEILSTAFEQEDGDISPINISSDERYYLVETLEVFPSQIPPLEDVKKQVSKLLIENKKQTQLQEQATKIVSELKQAENPKALAKERGNKLYKTGKIKRHHDTVSNAPKLKNKILPSELVQEIFALKVNEVSGAFRLPSGEMAIGILDAIHPAKSPNEKEIKATQSDLSGQIRLQALTAYLSALREKYKVELFLDKIVASNAAQ